jgi:hypothetical protein
LLYSILGEVDGWKIYRIQKEIKEMENGIAWEERTLGFGFWFWAFGIPFVLLLVV